MCAEVGLNKFTTSTLLIKSLIFLSCLFSGGAYLSKLLMRTEDRETRKKLADMFEKSGEMARGGKNITRK
jgi:hypothetical protein